LFFEFPCVASKNGNLNFEKIEGIFVDDAPFVERVRIRKFGGFECADHLMRIILFRLFHTCGIVDHS
jgi:hypothetical protein